MLQIIVRPSDTTPGGVIDLLPGTRLEIERPINAFDEDLSASEFSLPIEIEWTDNNRLIFGFSERLENFTSSKINSWVCDVFDDGYPELLEASINLLEKKGMITYTSGRFTANVSGTKGQFGSEVKGKYLKDYKFGGPVTWTNDESRVFATKHAKGMFPAMNQFKFAPVVIQEYFDTSKNYYGEFLAMDTVNNIISTGSGANDWVFARPQEDTPTLPTAPGVAEHIDFRTIPFLRTKWVLQQLIAELGYTLSGSALDDPILNDLYIFNTRSIENYDVTTFVDKNRKITPADHLPDMTVLEFLRKTFIFLNLYASFPGGQVLDIKRRDAFIKQRSILDVSAICVKEFTSQYTPVEDQGGYTLDYEHDTDDSYFGEAVRELEDKTMVATVNTVLQLATLNIGRAFTTNDVAMVASENMYYVVADATVLPVLWSAYSENLHPMVTGNGNRTVSIGAGTLATYVELDNNTGLYKRFSKLATRQAGCYINHRKVLVSHSFSLRFFYIKNQSIGVNSYPVSFNHNRNTANTVIEDYSLALQGPTSLGSLHKPWQDIQSHPEAYTLQLLSDRKLMNDLAINNMIMLNNVIMVPRQVSVSIPMQETVSVQAVPL